MTDDGYGEDKQPIRSDHGACAMRSVIIHSLCMLEVTRVDGRTLVPRRLLPLRPLG